MSKSLKVTLWGTEIGRLSWDAHRRLTYFTFNPAVLNGGLDIAPLIASVNDPGSRMPIYGSSEKIYQKLPPFLADSLPDDWGNQIFECWRMENKIANADITPLEKLSFIGRRGMGALEFEPETRNANGSEKIDVDSLVLLAQKIYSQRENYRILPEESITLQSLIAVGTSAGGRQPKAIIAINPATGEIRSGQVGGLKGFDYCIIKFGDQARSSAELEMAYYEMAVKAGINMTSSRLLDADDKKHFLTKRFDRDGDDKLHTQTLAALYPEADSYEKLLWVCRKMRLSERDCMEVFRRMIFNILANNTDDHNKNFSFTMDRNGHWELSPAYDVTFIFDSGGFLPQEERCLMVRGKLRDITRDDVLRFASDNGIRRPESIIRDVVGAVSSFRSIAEKYCVKEEWIGRIEVCLAHHLEAWGFPDCPLPMNESVAARIELAYRGNYHLIATIDGRERKYVIRTGTEENDAISRIGLANITPAILQDLVHRHFKN